MKTLRISRRDISYISRLALTTLKRERLKSIGTRDEIKLLKAVIRLKQWMIKHKISIK